MTAKKMITRAAFDIGSAKTKLTVAAVDTETNQIVHTFCQIVKGVELHKDLAASHEGHLSQEIQTQLISAIQEMKEEAASFAPQQWFGVGTSVFRKAKNGQQVLDRIKSETGVTIRLISQAEEGEIGFLSGVAVSQSSPEQVTIWDSGSGSFQMCTLIDQQIQMYGAEFAFVPALTTLFTLRQQPYSQTLSPNPVCADDASRLSKAISAKLPTPSIWLNQKPIIAIGGHTSLFSLVAIAIQRTTYTKEQVWDVISNLCGKTDEQLTIFPEPAKVVVALVLLYSVMHHCKVERLSYCPTNGGCEGVLITPRFWQK